jgi:hypothetical protein
MSRSGSRTAWTKTVEKRAPKWPTLRGKMLMNHQNLVGGFNPPPLKNDGVRQWEGFSWIIRKI